MPDSFVISPEHTSGFANDPSASLAPRNVSRVSLGINDDRFSVNDESTILGFNGATEFAVSRIVFELIRLFANESTSTVLSERQ